MLTIDAGALSSALRIVLPATRAGHQSVLRGVRLDGAGQKLTVTATDIDLTIETVVAADGDLGPVVVPAAALGGWADGHGGAVTLTEEDGELVASGETGAMRLRCFPADDWPVFEPVVGDAVPLDDAARDGLGRIFHAAARDGSRPVLCGVGVSDGWAVCTDSYRLAARRIAGLPEAIIPVRVLELAFKADGPATLAADDRRVAVTVGATCWTARLIEGQFPSWLQLVGEPARIVTVDREAALAALGRVLVLADTPEAAVRISPDGEGLTFTVSSADVGEVSERMTGGEGWGDTFGFRPRLLADMLRSHDEAKVEIGLTNQLKPVSIRDEDSVALVMPVRL